ncbi:butyrophilin-like protein 10 isoform X2 [Haplochromis burtoni]|uniref:butyrophilin-like protein 10 isoform X2 n=1 Tax=Haplochromis burtoni TaxID=8153 RepID=UPI001C2D691C|nr:butyrophilin-like protein 10 isoform X2 [Haplochromis burtoni]
MELLPLLFLSFCFLTSVSGLTFAAESGTPVARVTVKEDADAILPCSLGTSETIESMVFDWKKDGKQVFTYNNGTHHNNDLEDQSAEFKGRVSHFPEELKNGNASIKITDTRLEDKGNYICIFPKSQSGGIRFHIELAVGAAEPSVTNLDETNDWALLKCVVKGASPKPTVEWWDSNNQTIPSEEPQVSKKGERFFITLKTNVTKTDRYHCVATQKEIWHQAHTEINVRLNVPEPNTGWKIVAGVAVAVAVVLAVVVVGILLRCYIKNKKSKFNVFMNILIFLCDRHFYNLAYFTLFLNILMKQTEMN